MASAFNGVVDIGGIQYTYDTSKSGVNYLFRSYHDFKKTFTPIAERSGIPLHRIEQLFITYFRVEPGTEQDFAAIIAKDKQDLIKIFNAYLDYLKNSKSISGDSVISIMINRTYYKINDILDKLTGKPKDFSEISVTCTESKKKLEKL